jgi:hypothetical protein
MRKTASAFLAAVFLPVIAMAQTYNALTDWNSTSNTTANIWQYGTENTPGGAFTLFPDNNAQTSSPTYDIWDLRNSSAIDGPLIGFNSSGTTINVGSGLLWPSGVLQIAPGETPDDTVLRWAAPSSGSIDITGQFTDLQQSSVGLYILADGSAVFDSSYSGSSPHQAAVPFSLSNVSVTQGEDIDFIVDSGGDQNDDSVGLSATVSENSTSTWTGAAGDGNWFTATNWSPNGSPGAGQNAAVSNGETATIGSPLNDTGGSILASGTGSTVNIESTVTGGTLNTSEGGVIAGDGGTLNDLTNAGTVTCRLSSLPRGHD